MKEEGGVVAAPVRIVRRVKLRGHVAEREEWGRVVSKVAKRKMKMFIIMIMMMMRLMSVMLCYVMYVIVNVKRNEIGGGSYVSGGDDKILLFSTML